MNSLPFALKQSLLKYRLSNHTLPIQSQRQIDIPREERICNYCDMVEIGDEFHYLFNCSHPDIQFQRRKFLSKYYLHHANTQKFNSLMNIERKSVLMNLAKFVKFILGFVKH